MSVHSDLHSTVCCQVKSVCQ